MDDVETYLRTHHAATAELALRVRGHVRRADPDLTEQVYRGWKGVGFRHPEAGYVCAIFPRDDHVELLFEHGASLPDPEGVLRGDAKQTRFIRIDEPADGDAGVIERYVQQAIAQRLLG
jgi:hypothetical protein